MPFPPDQRPDDPLAITRLGFPEARARALDIAAYLDRVERYGESGDIRHQAMRLAIAILADDQPDKARRILEALSDPTSEPLEAAHSQGAIGVWPDIANPPS